MIIVVDKKEQVANIENYLNTFHIHFYTSHQKTCSIIETLTDTFPFDEKNLYAFEGVLSIHFNQKKYLWDLKNHPQYTSILLDNWQIDNQHITIIAGPCSIENEQQLQQIASKIKPLGCNILRAGAYKPRTSPYDFQGLEEKGLQLLFEIKKKYHLPVISEITSIEHLDLFVQYVDIIQVGARNMQNFELLKALGKINKPILLKRGMGNTIEELLLSAEYILSGGRYMNYNIKNGILEMQGFDIGGKILISDACEVTFSDEENGEYEKKSKRNKSFMEVETLRFWIKYYGLLDEIEL